LTIRDSYTDWSSTYDTDLNLTRDLDQDVTRRTFAPQRYRAILELGCGTGKNTVFLTGISERVVALDFSEGMIALAKQKVQGANVQFAVADLTQPWPCANQTMDLITCNLVLEHIDDLMPIFSEAYRVLINGGLFFICELHPAKQYNGKKATFQRAAQQTEIPAYIHHISTFLDAANSASLNLTSLKEWWHPSDPPIPPRLVSFTFEK
jgi:ubiquinone/menaquinone biosynthesis C-methylase UbiE